VLREHRAGTPVLRPYTPDGWTGPEAVKRIEAGHADLISYAALFLAGPDLPERLAAGGPFTTPDYGSAHGGDHEGYPDYPALTTA
jgi:N-ethylmaleimide reductase